MRRWRTTAAGLWLATLLIGSAHAARATDEIIGSVLAVRGAVSVESGADVQPLTDNAALHRGDTIVSTAGKAKIALNNGTIISVAENSSLRLADYAGTSRSVKAHVNLITGALRLLVAKVGPAGKFEIETETAIAAVRGTGWVIEATPERTSVAVLSGRVAVYGRGGKARAPVLLRSPGQGTDVRRGEAPTPVATWGAQRLSDILARTTYD